MQAENATETEEAHAPATTYQDVAAHVTYDKAQKVDRTHLSKAQSSRAYVRLQSLSFCVENEYAFFRKYLSVSRNVLKAFLIEETQETLEAHMPDPQNVCEFMARKLLAPATVFTDEFYRRKTFSINILKNIAELYRFSEIDEYFLHEIHLRNTNSLARTAWTWFG